MDARSSPEVDIVIPVWNQPDVTQRCLRSLVECTEMPLRLILIDNASSAETQTLLTKFQPPERFLVTRIRNPENLGFVKAVNQGIRAGSAPWVCLLNNDTVVTPGWLEEMLKVALSDPSVGLVNPTSNSLGFSPGEQPLEAFALGCKRFSGQWTQLTSALGFCLLARRSLLESGGTRQQFR